MKRTPSRTRSPLFGRRILVVEDEYFISDDIREALVESGAEVVGPIPDLETGLQLAQSEPLDCAVLDINLRGEEGLAIASELNRRGVPFLFATGYAENHLSPEWQGSRVLEKPVKVQTLLAALSDLCKRNDAG